jgi:hypothetical protein
VVAGGSLCVTTLCLRVGLLGMRRLGDVTWTRFVFVVLEVLTRVVEGGLVVDVVVGRLLAVWWSGMSESPPGVSVSG